MPGRFQVGEQLRGVNGQQDFYGFQLHNEGLGHQKIQAALPDKSAFVLYGHMLLQGIGYVS